MKKKMLEIIFFITTILMGLISTGKIEIDKAWEITIFTIQVISWLGYINTINMEKLPEFRFRCQMIGSFALGLFYFIK